jgi:hypothetical protein
MAIESNEQKEEMDKLRNLAAEQFAVILLRSLEESLIAKKELLNSKDTNEKEHSGGDRLGISEEQRLHVS